MNRADTALLERTPACRVLSPDDATALVGTDVGDREPNVVTPSVYTDEDSGQPVLAYLPLGDVADLRRAVREVEIRETYRAASGRRNASRVFGWSPRRPVQRREACNSTSFAKEQPREQAVLDHYARRLSDLLRGIDPAVAARDEETMGAVLPEWRMAGTTWTSGVVNQNSQLPYHRDGFNFPTWSAMPVLRRACDGGHLHLPEYDLTVACRDGWAVFFCGQQLLHGVTPMRLTKPDGYRFSVVYYSLRGMKDCHTFAEETRLAQQRRTERERGMATGVQPHVAIRQSRPALQAWLADNHPAPAYVKVLSGDPPRYSVASETEPALTEWAGFPVIWNMDPAEGRGKTDTARPDRRIVTTTAVLPTEAEVAAQGPDDPVLMAP